MLDLLEQLDRIMQWAALLGLAIILVARFCGELPYSLYSSSEYWLNGPWLILIKLGVLLLVVELQDDGSIRVLADTSEITRLGEQALSDHVLKQLPMARTVSATSSTLWCWPVPTLMTCPMGAWPLPSSRAWESHRM